MLTDKPRFTITMDEALFDQIEEYKFNNRFKNQTKVVISLIEKGLDVLSEKDPEIASAINKKAPIDLDGDEEKLIGMYRALNQEGREKLLDTADDMVQSKKYKEVSAGRMGKTQLA